jgi:CDP-diacylglycerol--glycerol-3-phosphate 3-phosphatidyltransferase
MPAGGVDSGSSMANLITLSRLLLLFVVVAIAYQPSSWLKLLDVPLLIFVFVTDGLDGYVARKRGETSLFGAMFDIAVDRIVELTLWVVLAHLGLVPVWVPLVFVVRGSIVDAIRAQQSNSGSASPFDVMQSPLARFLVAGRFMRAFYAVMKAIAFCWLLLMQPLPDLLPTIWAQWSWLLHGVSAALIWFVVGLCLARGLPVIIEFLAEQRRLIAAPR